VRRLVRPIGLDFAHAALLAPAPEPPSLPKCVIPRKVNGMGSNPAVRTVCSLLPPLATATLPPAQTIEAPGPGAIRGFAEAKRCSCWQITNHPSFSNDPYIMQIRNIDARVYNLRLACITKPTNGSLGKDKDTVETSNQLVPPKIQVMTVG
jgi:hypothetical protein